MANKKGRSIRSKNGEVGNGQNCLHGDAVWLHAKQGRTFFLMNKAPSCQNLEAGKVGGWLKQTWCVTQSYHRVCRKDLDLEFSDVKSLRNVLI